MAWEVLLTDLNGNVHGDLTTINERKITLPHMRVPSFSGLLPLQSEYANLVMDTDTLIRASRINPATGTKTLAFHGPVVTAEEAATTDKQGIALVAAGPFWRVTKRFIGKGAAAGTPAKPPGYSWGIPTPADLGLAAHTILDTINGEGYTGIGKGTRGAVTTGAFGPWYLKNAAEAIAELHAGVSSFEYVVDPTQPVSVGGVGGWPQIGLMRIASVIGALQPDAIFEYGTGKANTESYSRLRSLEGIMTKGWISVSGYPGGNPAGTDILSSTSSAEVTARGLYEDVVPDASVINTSLRQSIVDFHLLYRKMPRKLITFNPAINASPYPLIDYNSGDTVRARAVVGGSLRFDALFRIWSVTFSVDSNGNETIELELVIP